MSRYRLEVTAHGKPGFYESGSLLRLFLEIIKHRTMHLVKHGRWED